MLLLSLFLVLGILSACGPSDKGTSNTDTGNKSVKKDNSNDGISEAKPAKLVVWEDQQKEAALKPAIKSFEDKYGIKVEFKTLPMADKMREQLRLDGPAGTGPDVFTVPHDQIGQLVVQGLMRPLDVPSSITDIYTESSIAAETYNGKLYGLPKAVETPVFIYNKKLLDKAPETFDDLYTFSKDFTKGGKYGFLFLGDNFYFAHAYMAGFGGYVFNNNNGTLDPKDIAINNDGAVQGAEWIAKWYKEGLFPKGIVGKNGGSTLDGLFNEGKVASKMDGPWSFDTMKKAGIDYGVAPLPKLPNGQYPKTFIGVKGWHVSAFSKSPQWSTKLVEWLTNAENAKIRFDKTGEIPPVKSLLQDPSIANNEGAKAVFVQAQRGEPMPNIPEMSQVWDPMASALQLIVTNKQAPKAALDNAKKTIETNIKQLNSK
ncbi:MAG TPA: extracellular solute-binding protein [Sporolactobacillaceae bacterium]|nr:extracellular solute-binding protein [Sporolactobacillaceae bacterium]